MSWWPCGAECMVHHRGRGGERGFNVAILVHGVSIKGLEGGALVKSQMPVITISNGRMTLETMPGEWSAERGQWLFTEALSMEVTVEDKLAVHVIAVGSYSLLGSESKRSLARATLQVQEVLPRFRSERRAGLVGGGRDDEGPSYAAPPAGFDLYDEQGAMCGRIFLSFETKTPLPLFRPTDETAATEWSRTDVHWGGGWVRHKPKHMVS